MQYQLEMIGYDAVLIRFTDANSAQLLPIIYTLNKQLRNDRDLAPAIIDIIPSYQTLLISFNIVKIEAHQLTEKIRQYVHGHISAASNQSLSAIPNSNMLISLPVCYHESLAPDLDALSLHAALPIDEIIHIHSSTIYSCYAIGFMPNFAYLGDVDKRIQMPRHRHPKTQVKAGSVGIAGNQTAIYPRSSPGGWQIIGQSPALLSSLAVGCQVKFNPISLDEFNHYHHEADT